MDEKNEIEIVPAIIEADTSVTSQPAETSQGDEMDLDAARAILQTLVDTHEDTLPDVEHVDNIGGHSTEELRKALRIVAQSIVDEHGSEQLFHVPGDDEQGYVTEISKSEGILSLYLDNKSLTMDFATHDNLQNSELTIRSVFPLVPLTELSDEERGEIGFYDARSRQSTNLGKIGKNVTLADFKLMLRGLRWTAANMLDANGTEMIMPEHLDHKGLPPASS